MSHTPEPWYMRTIRPIDTDGKDWGWVDGLPTGGSPRPIAGVQITWTRGTVSEANARRIVTCVNACKDVDNETLEKIASGDMDGSEIFELAKLRRQREALLEALDVMDQALLEVAHAQRNGSSWYTNRESGLYQQVQMWIGRGATASREARAAIAAVEEEK